MKNYEEIAEFNVMLGNQQGDKVKLTEAQVAERVTFISEELEELKEASTLTDQVDALADILVFAIGGLHIAGLTPDEMQKVLTAVYESNIQKSRGVNAKRDVLTDAVKPEGWIGPESKIREILNDVF